MLTMSPKIRQFVSPGGFVWDYGIDSERQTDRRETSQILKEIYQEIIKDSNCLVYSHKWEVGDFIISDNLAVGHEATPETQLPSTCVRGWPKGLGSHHHKEEVDSTKGGTALGIKALCKFART